MNGVARRATGRATGRATVLLLAVCAALACDEAEPVGPTADGRLVVQAYLYAGEPVTDVRVTATLPLGATESVAPPITDASVALVRNGERHTLVPTPGADGSYHYPGTDLVVAEGDVFDLEVTAGGMTATARTQVPPPPAAFEVTPAVQEVAGGSWASLPVVARWANPARSWHFLTYRNIEDDPEPIFQQTVIVRQGLVVLEPTVTDSTVISAFTLRHFGEYEVTLYRVNEEYVHLYTSLRQDTRDLNEPATNIVNGIGIFTAFNQRTTTFRLARQ